MNTIPAIILSQKNRYTGNLDKEQQVYWKILAFAGKNRYFGTPSTNTGENTTCHKELTFGLATLCRVSQSAVRRSFQHLRGHRIYSVNVLNFQSTVFISNFMHMREKTVCEF